MLDDELIGKPKTFHTFEEIDDLSRAIEYVHKTFPEAPVSLVGLSMGGNNIVRWLARNKVKKNLYRNLM